VKLFSGSLLALPTKIRLGYKGLPGTNALALQSVTQFISVTIMNLVTPKVGAKQELLFNKPATVNNKNIYFNE
jgi:hypothetical protein